VFRVDLPVSWLLTVLHQVVHGAAQEIAAGRLDPERAPELISTTALAMFTPPAT
jgi:TetR/AcrR family transcriptional regulator, mexCD-oprJ operon repressor